MQPPLWASTAWSLERADTIQNLRTQPITDRQTKVQNPKFNRSEVTDREVQTIRQTAKKCNN